MSEHGVAAGTARTRPLWRNVSFMLMWSSVAASGFGDRLLQLAAEPMLGVYIPGTSAAQVTAAIMFCFFLPYMVLTVVGGWLADHLPRKWIMLACDEFRAVILLIAFFMAAGLGTTKAIDSSHHWKVYLVLAATGAFAAIFNPAKQSTVPQIVRTEHLQPANAVLAGIALIASLIGLRIGGPIVENVSVQMGLMVGVLSYGISGFFFAFMKPVHRPPRAEPRSTGAARARGGLAGALTYMARHEAVRHLVILNILFWSGAWVVNAAIAALNRTQYGIPVETYLTSKSKMLAVLGAGLLAGSLVVIWIRTRRESGLVALAALVAASVSMFGLALNRSYTFGLVLAFTIGLFGGVFLICIDTLTQSITPNHIRGRVFGTRALLNTVSAVVVNLLIWRAPDADFWMIPVLAVTAAATGIVAVWSLWRSLRRGPLESYRLNVMWHIVRVYMLVWHRLRWVNRHHVPLSGPAIIASNHTTGLDGFMIQIAVPRTIRFLMDRIHMFRILNFIWNAADMIGIDPQRTEMAPVREVVRRARAGELVGIFPEGSAQRDRRELMPFHGGVGMVAVRSHALIVPVWIEGTPRSKHMFWHFVHPSRSTITFGRAYRPDPTLSNDQVAEDLRQRMMALAGDANRQ